MNVDFFTVMFSSLTLIILVILLKNIIINIIKLFGNDIMGITSFIKTRLLNNRVEQYNTRRSYWGEDER